MPITAPDIKLLESERMADTTDGGGRRTSRVIPDGVAGNIFPKVSRLDSVYGRVNLRKVYGAVQTADVDTYAGSHAVITDAPDNSKIHTTLFSTASDFDARNVARDRIESYVTTSSESRMTFIGRQLAGQQSILVYQRVEEPLPEIGEVFCLSNESGSTVTTQQYVRIGDITHDVRTYTDEKGEFQRRAINIDIGVPLRYEFSGPDTPSRYSGPARASKVRETTVVDAARYYGIQKLAEAAGTNDLQVRVASVYTPIVPTTNRETPISNEGINESVAYTPASSVKVTESVSLNIGSGPTKAYLKRAVVPGSLTFSQNSWTAYDDGLGNYSSPQTVGTIDYENGIITTTGGGAWGTFTVQYTPAALTSQPVHTVDIPVDLNNRGTVYVKTLNPLPSPETIIVDYRALGKWYRLRDKADGTLAGSDAAYGVGTIDYATGSLVLTLGALPDIDSSVLISYGSPVHYAVRAGATADAGAFLEQTFTLPDLPVNPDSFSLTYTSGGAQYTATDSSSGVITGNGVEGTINYTSGDVYLKFTTRLPDSSSNVACSYQQITPADPQIPVVRSLSLASGSSMDLDDSIVAGSVLGSATFAGSAIAGFTGQLAIKDTGLGTLMVPGGQVVPVGIAEIMAKVVQDTIIGTIDYITGVITINASVPVSAVGYDPQVGNWDAISSTMSITSGPANFGWKSAGAGGANAAKTFDVGFTPAPLKFDLTTTIAHQLVPGSLLFTLGGKTYIDRNGTLYADVSSSTGAGTTAGTVDYTTGKVSLSYWTDGAALGVSVSSALTVYGEHTAYEFYFRTPGSPIRPGSFYVQATTAAGQLISGTSNENGYITGTKVNGTVDQETGVVRVWFGGLVTAAGNESEWWYNAANIVGGQIFKPELVIPSTLAFNCVVLSNLPLNADILGLDPVRLPMDGRVPIYRPADVVVIHNTQDFALPNPAVAGATYNVGRTNLSELWLVDQNGVKLPADQYIYSLNNGTVTMSAELVTGGLVQPLIAKHRIEDMALVSDVQINGQLTLTSPIPRPYPANTSFVSSALLFGDMNARVENLHDLQAFSSWTNTPGTGATAQYNDIDYPIEVLNNGALTERWRINFTSTSAFQVIGENLGVIATGSTGLDCSPTNQLTGQPYFVIRAAGWGSGWSAGNQLRFNTIGATAPIWIARTVLPGATLEGDAFSIQLRGDVDAA